MQLCLYMHTVDKFLALVRDAGIGQEFTLCRRTGCLTTLTRGLACSLDIPACQQAGLRL